MGLFCCVVRVRKEFVETMSFWFVCVMPYLKSGLSIFHWTFLRGALSLINPTHKIIK
jgi:hypothetical protein